MKRPSEILREYFENTPQDVLEREWNVLKESNNYGPDAITYANEILALLEETQFSDIEVSSMLKSSYKEEKLYLAA